MAPNDESLSAIGRAFVARWGGEAVADPRLGYVRGEEGAHTLLRYVVLSASCDNCERDFRPEDVTEAEELVLCVACDRAAAKAEGVPA